MDNVHYICIINLIKGNMKLISMTDFVLEQSKKIMNCELTHLESHHQIVDYANFLKQPLKLEMFVPCDEYGNVLEEPKGWKNENCNVIDCCNICKCEQYQQAKDKVLFEGFVLDNDELINNGVLFWVGKFDGKEIVENCISSNLTLTPKAIKQL